MRVGIATDHNGVEQKIDLIYHMAGLGFEVVDFSKDNTPTDDYPDFAKRVADAIVANEVDLGILLCGTGIGMAIAANKVKGIRAAKVSSEQEAALARQHNNANIMTLSYKEDMDKLKQMITVYLSTPFSEEERHQRRVDKISAMEQ